MILFGLYNVESDVNFLEIILLGDFDHVIIAARVLCILFHLDYLWLYQATIFLGQIGHGGTLKNCERH